MLTYNTYNSSTSNTMSKIEQLKRKVNYFNSSFRPGNIVYLHEHPKRVRLVEPAKIVKTGKRQKLVVVFTAQTADNREAESFDLNTWDGLPF